MSGSKGSVEARRSMRARSKARRRAEELGRPVPEWAAPREPTTTAPRRARTVLVCDWCGTEFPVPPRAARRPICPVCPQAGRP